MSGEHRTNVARMARELMNQHGLTDWTFSWDGARARFGLCNYTQKRINLSVRLVDLNTEERCRLTILHEIAHALAGHKAGHGYEWRRICRAIGGNGQRCFTAANTEAPKGSLKATCARCVVISATVLMISGGIVSILFAISLWAMVTKRTWSIHLVTALALFDFIGEFVAQGTIGIEITVSFIVATLLLILMTMYRKQLHRTELLEAK